MTIVPIKEICLPVQAQQEAQCDGQGGTYWSTTESIRPVRKCIKYARKEVGRVHHESSLTHCTSTSVFSLIEQFSRFLLTSASTIRVGCTLTN